MKKNFKYLKTACKRVQSCVARLLQEPSIVDATPRTLSLCSGGLMATTDKKNFEEEGLYNNHDSILPPTQVLDLPMYLRRTTNIIDRMETLQAERLQSMQVEKQLEKQVKKQVETTSNVVEQSV